MIFTFPMRTCHALLTMIDVWTEWASDVGHALYTHLRNSVRNTIFWRCLFMLPSTLWWGRYGDSNLCNPRSVCDLKMLLSHLLFSLIFVLIYPHFSADSLLTRVSKSYGRSEATWFVERMACWFSGYPCGLAPQTAVFESMCVCEMILVSMCFASWWTTSRPGCPMPCAKNILCL